MPYKILLFICFAALITGCQSTSIQVPPLVNPGGDVTLIFNRENTVLTSIGRARVYIGDIDVCAIPIGDSCQVNISAGRHVLKVFSFADGNFGTFSHAYQFESGKTYRFIISPNNLGIAVNFVDPGSIVYGVANVINHPSKDDSNDGSFTMKLVDEY
jgi:hypothetical protein